VVERQRAEAAAAAAAASGGSSAVDLSRGRRTGLVAGSAPQLLPLKWVALPAPPLLPPLSVLPSAEAAAPLPKRAASITSAALRRALLELLQCGWGDPGLCNGWEPGGGVANRCPLEVGAVASGAPAAAVPIT
jgi:hypothetical protein